MPERGTTKRQFLGASVDRLCISAAGQDAASYLHSQLSNDVESMVDGEVRYSFVLEPTGKIICLVRVIRLDRHLFVLDTDPVPGLEDVLISRLNRFKIRVSVEFSVHIAHCLAIRALGEIAIPPEWRDELGVPGSAVAVDAWWCDGRALDVIPIGWIADAMHEQGDHEFLGTVTSLLAANPEVSMAGATELERERVRSGWPSTGAEIIPGETIVAATGLAAAAVSFTKGCYPGQELVERMDSRGSNAPRTLRRMARHDLPNSRHFVAGDVIVIDGVEVANVTSVAGEWILGYVGRNVELGEPVGRARAIIDDCDVVSPADCDVVSPADCDVVSPAD